MQSINNIITKKAKTQSYEKQISNYESCWIPPKTNDSDKKAHAIETLKYTSDAKMHKLSISSGRNVSL
jgi:hypothetical protein